MSEAIQGNRLVAVCDVLGFSNLVLRSPPADVLARPVSFVRRALGWAIYKEDFPESAPSFDELRNQDRVGFSWFSDTVLFYALDDTDDACLAVLETVGWLLFATMLARDGWNTRFRAGLSYGQMVIDKDNHLYLGRALVEAARLEANQAWAGGALSPSAADRVNARKNAENFEYWITLYNPPLKDPSRAPSEFAVDWTKGGHQRFDVEWLQTSPEPSFEDCMREPKVVEKWYNTRQFHRDVCPSCFDRASTRVGGGTAP